MYFTLVDESTRQQVGRIELRYSPVIGMTIRTLNIRGDSYLPGMKYVVTGVEEVAVAYTEPVKGVQPLHAVHSILYVKSVGEATTENCRPLM